MDQTLHNVWYSLTRTKIRCWTPHFGMPTANYGNTNQWWDMPSNRHDQGANLSFADSHAEHWRWAVPKIAQINPMPVTTADRPDYDRVRAIIRQNP